MTRYPLTRLTLLGLLLLTAQPLVAQHTDAVSFNGRLTTADGHPLADGTYTVTFRLYSKGHGGTAHWQEAHTVTTRQGAFTVLLGQREVLPWSTFEGMPYLAVEVDGEELGPRLAVSAAPYALSARLLDERALVAGDNVAITRQEDGRLKIAAVGRGQQGGAVSASASGAMMVVTDGTTLVGDGTVGDPLGVAVPLELTTPSTGHAIRGQNGLDNYGVLGGGVGAYGEHNSGNRGYLGHSLWGAYGQNDEGSYGYLGGDHGVYGQNNEGFSYGWLGGHSDRAYGEYLNSNQGSGGGNRGYLGTSNYGVQGWHGSSNNFGYLGSSSTGAYGAHSEGHFGVLGGSSYGARGHNDNNNRGFLGHDNYGASGRHNNGHYGTLGGTDYGVYGWNTNDNRGYLGHDSFGVFAAGSPWAGYFYGDVHVLGTLSKGGGSFKIDHPLDPEGRYLTHSFVESPDMMNVNNGTAVLDARGEAIVALPDYFEALNRDFRYQLTAIGSPGPNLYIAEKISDNRFTIAGGVPGVKVSWQVTGIRQDPWAEANRIVVEQAKLPRERGHYLHPTLYGQPEERSVAWALDPEGMQEMKQMPLPLEEEQRQIEEEQRRMDEERQRMQVERERVQQERRRPQPRPDDHR